MGKDDSMTSRKRKVHDHDLRNNHPVRQSLGTEPEKGGPTLRRSPLYKTRKVVNLCGPIQIEESIVKFSEPKSLVATATPKRF
jgi:hypothetical protein